MRRLRLRVNVGAALAASVIGFAAGDAAVVAVPGGAELVGRAGTSLSVGVVTEQRRAAAFVSDGKRVGVWLAGRVRNGEASLVDGMGGQLRMKLAGKGSTGTLRLAGRPAIPVSVNAVSGEGGVFALARRTVGSSGTTVERTGWVVSNDGRVRGVRRTDRSGGSTSFDAAPAVAADARRVTPASLLPACKPVKRSRVDVADTDPPGCGLPSSAPPPAERNVFAIRRNPKASRLTDGQVRAAAAEARAGRRAAMRSLGLLLPTAAQRRAFETWVAKVRSNAGVIDAARRLREALLSKNIDRVSNRLADYESAAGAAGLDSLPPTLRRIADSFRRELPRKPTALPRPSSSPATSLVVRNTDFALATQESQSGLFVSWVITKAFIQESGEEQGSIALQAWTDVGWHSTAEGEATAIARFVVPAGVREVEVQFDGRLQVHASQLQCMLGVADRTASTSMEIHRVTSSGDTVFVTQVSRIDWGAPPPICPSLPIPDPAPLAPATESNVVTFSPPAGGGAHQINLVVQASADVLGAGTAGAMASLGLDKATVRFRR